MNKCDFLKRSLPKLILNDSYMCREEFQSEFFDEQLAHKFLFELPDTYCIETAVYDHRKAGATVDIAVDIASMVGCPVGCQFCAATSGRYHRPLSHSEMVAQYIYAVRLSEVKDFGKAIAAFQGIGEPSLIAGDILTAAEALVRRDNRIVISISTTGANLVGIALWRQSHIPIAVLQFSISSSYGPHQLIPQAPAFENFLTEIVLCSSAPNIASVKANYVLIEGVNDSPDHIASLARHFSGTAVNVRIASLNKTRTSERFGLRPASRQAAKDFYCRLVDKGVRASIFGAFSDTTVSCGQLVFT